MLRIEEGAETSIKVRSFRVTSLLVVLTTTIIAYLIIIRNAIRNIIRNNIEVSQRRILSLRVVIFIIIGVLKEARDVLEILLSTLIKDVRVLLETSLVRERERSRR